MSVLFFCVGATKAGTSWLYTQLAAHPECHFRAIKELHYFDALEDDALEQELDKHRRQHARILAKVAAQGGDPGPRQSRRLRDISAWINVLERGAEDRDAYLDYLRDGAGDAKVIGDITPAYCVLTAARLRVMSDLAPNVRFSMLLRDPVERLWSHVRMIAARRDRNGQATSERCARILNKTFKGKEDDIAKRSDYAGALERLAAAVPSGKVLVDVFEDMVTGEGFARICNFLGIRAIEPSPVPVHAGQPLPMSPEQRRAAAQWLAPQYEASARVLGRMPEAWIRKGQL